MCIPSDPEILREIFPPSEAEKFLYHAMQKLESYLLHHKGQLYLEEILSDFKTQFTPLTRESAYGTLQPD